MNLDQIETKCFILALFIRDDGERFLLGSRAYEFLDSQLHFAANSYQNDIVEVQGNDGIMLAGQVRRATSQAFDGYIGDSSVNRTTIEQYRQDFLKFFRKNHYYKVVYVFPNGSAIQRRNGFIVEAPEVKELYQLFPQYHISMNFEDINYYEYKEDEDGQEIYGESASLNVSTAATGGLIWEERTQTTTTKEGTNFTILGTEFGDSIDNVKLSGDTFQQTYSGKNLFNAANGPNINNLVSDVAFDETTYTLSVPSSSSTSSGNRFTGFYITSLQEGTTYTISYLEYTGSIATDSRKIMVRSYDGSSATTLGTLTSSKTQSFTVPVGSQRIELFFYTTQGTTSTFSKIQLEQGSTATDYEPYVGGIPSPNPDYPQEVQTVTGRQVVTVSDGGSQSQEYEINLGGELFNSGDVKQGYYIDINGLETTNSGWAITGYMPVEAGRQYKYSGLTGVGSNPYSAFYDKDKIFVSSFKQAIGDNTITIPNNCKYVRFSMTITDYNVGNFSFMLDMTPIELCKISTYQDYIYKSGDDWYVHKAVGKYTFTGNETLGNASEGGTGYQGYYIGTSYYSNILVQKDAPCLMETFIQRTYAKPTSAVCFMINGSANIVWVVNDTVTMAVLKTILAGTDFYYPLATPTDTQITNTALIAQLEALAGATTYASQTIFTVTSPNQLGILSLSTTVIDGGGVVWDSIGATWEEGTGGGPTMISVDSIDNVYPIWEVTGPAVNPQISVLTTNTTLSYTGTITSSQTLKVDMFNKTAVLNGTSVIGNVSGDWVNLAPGINRVTYTTNNADAPDSTLWWQEIVG